MWKPKFVTKRTESKVHCTTSVLVPKYRMLINLYSQPKILTLTDPLVLHFTEAWHKTSLVRYSPTHFVVKIYECECPQYQQELMKIRHIKGKGKGGPVTYWSLGSEVLETSLFSEPA